MVGTLVSPIEGLKPSIMSTCTSTQEVGTLVSPIEGLKREQGQAKPDRANGRNACKPD